MSWLKRLFGEGEASAGEERADQKPAREKRPASPARVALPVHSRRIVSVPEIDFVGERSVSPNRRWTLLWHDRHWIEGEAVSGRYVLLDGGIVAVDARMERPQDGKVADDGTFILNDWADSQTLSGTFFGFRTDGSEIVRWPYSANLLNNGVSPDGRLAVCQTCNAPGSADSSILSVFDLASGAEIACWTPESGWANGYEFPEGGDRIRMIRGNRPPLDYSLSGDFLDRRLWLKDEVERGTLHVIRTALAEGEAATGLSLETLRRGVRTAIAQGDERFRAEAWRLLGEVEESADDRAAALAAYEQALALNPKVGVAKRAAALRKTAGT